MTRKESMRPIAGEPEPPGGLHWWLVSRSPRCYADMIRPELTRFVDTGPISSESGIALLVADCCAAEGTITCPLIAALTAR